MVIAIDGPAASGKSSVSRAVAAKLGFCYVNSGNLYRAATWLALRTSQIGAPGFPESLLRELQRGPFEISVSEGQMAVCFEGTLLAPELSVEEVNQNVSKVASHPQVREWVLEKLRAIARDLSVVMEGRDIGSVVFPGAEFKFYLDASPEVRERRRRAQGIDDSILERDRLDTTRQAAPLQLAPGAILIDSSDLTFDQTVEAILAKISARNPG